MERAFCCSIGDGAEILRVFTLDRLCCSADGRLKVRASVRIGYGIEILCIKALARAGNLVSGAHEPGAKPHNI
jgi:hypothetical protein